MAGEDAVFTAAVARDEVRKSLARMEYHLNRGRKGERGWLRERDFLNALGRQSSKLGGGAGTAIGGAPGLGERALRAMQIQNANGAPSAATGRLKSSILGDFSADTMNGAREWTYDGQQEWIWTANASACPACLDNHGKRFTGPFVPMHPSCLCFPQQPVDAAAQGVRPLDTRQVVGTLTKSNNPQFRAVGQQIRAGITTTKEAAGKAARQSSGDLKKWSRAVDDQVDRAIAVNEGREVLPQPPTGARSAPSQRGGTTTTEVPNSPTTSLEGPLGEPPVVDDLPAFVDIPSFAQTEAALAAQAVPKGGPVKWVTQLFDAPDAQGTPRNIKLGAKKHRKQLEAAQESLEATVDSAELREVLAAAIDDLTELETRAKLKAPNGKSYAGVYEHYKSPVINKSGQVTQSEFSFRAGGQAMRLAMREGNRDEILRWNDDVRKHGHLKADAAQARNRARFGSVEYEELDEEYQRLRKAGPNKKDYELYRDRPVEHLAGTWLHETVHAADTKAMNLWRKSAVDNGMGEKMRAVASGTDEYAAAFRYGSEIARPAAQQKGAETVAELVRMYYYGTGSKTPPGLPELSAGAWRKLYPDFAKWVEDEIIGGGAVK